MKMWYILASVVCVVTIAHASEHYVCHPYLRLIGDNCFHDHECCTKMCVGRDDSVPWPGTCFDHRNGTDGDAGETTGGGGAGGNGGASGGGGVESGGGASDETATGVGEESAKEKKDAKKSKDKKGKGKKGKNNKNKKNKDKNKKGSKKVTKTESGTGTEENKTGAGNDVATNKD